MILLTRYFNYLNVAPPLMMDCINSVFVSKSQKMTFYVDLSASQDIKVCSVTDDSIVAQINCARKISFRNNM